mmetsp:Transcript_39291/g.65987  ORF Transcript_39291/g.65987 Transcript_39291/m.65987 type:complete len:81 (+) Transcript_39291:155-397(+)
MIERTAVLVETGRKRARSARSFEVDSVQQKVRAEAKKLSKHTERKERKDTEKTAVCKGPVEKEKTPGGGDEVERLRGRSK